MPPLVSEGLNLVIYGMGTVFVFLTMLVLVTMLMSYLVGRFEPAPVPAGPAPRKDAKKLAAIAAAVEQHRNR